MRTHTSKTKTVTLEQRLEQAEAKLRRQIDKALAEDRKVYEFTLERDALLETLSQRTAS